MEMKGRGELLCTPAQYYGKEGTINENRKNYVRCLDFIYSTETFSVSLCLIAMLTHASQHSPDLSFLHVKAVRDLVICECSEMAT